MRGQQIEKADSIEYCDIIGDEKALKSIKPNIEKIITSTEIFYL